MIRTTLFAGRLSRTLLAVCGFSMVSAMVSAAPITGGMTTVALDSATLATLQSLFTIGTVSPTMISTSGGVTTVNFPITGGDTSTGIINHSGGLTLTGTATPTGVGTLVSTANYVINLNTAVLSGDVSVNGGSSMSVALFDIGAGDVLTVDSALAGDLTTLFGVPNLTGATVGTATVSPVTSSTPEPASFALAGAGLLASLAFFRRQRKA